ncbi:hypothetical protein NOC27_859 [Nitrosococcus oceani AFC27]|nr:hypothetical protein NOC27_859 [Nitrosococcus oceani AFC27]
MLRIYFLQHWFILICITSSHSQIREVGEGAEAMGFIRELIEDGAECIF